jgi:hypothetical protein
MHITSSGYDVTRIAHSYSYPSSPLPSKILSSGPIRTTQFYHGVMKPTPISSRSIWPSTRSYVRSFPCLPDTILTFRRKTQNVTNEKIENVANDSEIALSPDYMYNFMYRPSVVSKRASLFQMHR